MLTTTMKYAEKYNYLDEKFQKAFCFLRETDLLALPVGNVPIDIASISIFNMSQRGRKSSVMSLWII